MKNQDIIPNAGKKTENNKEKSQEHQRNGRLVGLRIIPNDNPRPWSHTHTHTLTAVIPAKHTRNKIIFRRLF